MYLFSTNYFYLLHLWISVGLCLLSITCFALIQHFCTLNIIVLVPAISMCLMWSIFGSETWGELLAFRVIRLLLVFLEKSLFCVWRWLYIFLLNFIFLLWLVARPPTDTRSRGGYMYFLILLPYFNFYICSFFFVFTSV